MESETKIVSPQIVYLQGGSGAVSEEGEGPGVAEDLLRQRGRVHTLEHRSMFLREEESTEEVETFTEKILHNTELCINLLQIN